MLSSTIKVYLINLDRSPDRLANAVKNLNRVGLSFERISAVDGTKLDMKNIDSFAVREAVEKNSWITQAVIGCAISHYLAYDKFIASGGEWALILEDDVELLDGAVDVLNKAIEVASKTDIFSFFFANEEKVFSNVGKIDVCQGHYFYPALTLWSGYSAGAYLIHRDLAIRLRAYVFPVHTSADSYGVFNRDGVIGGLYALLPPVSKPSYFGSDISYSKMGRLLRNIEKSKFPFSAFMMRTARNFLKTTSIKYRINDDLPEWFPKK